ncbi:MAG: hypothetical protein HN742_36230 [Lentisphaerae bacterium]|jgi:hypothetical protein|nr:hypothetical protein [Lentisphaerota bacterium]MBT4823278.1 hypothetical protein [Lentisphaerota bacterium]MBT5607685.1 hypothetical protein [Lentisphaerota bacterium]MBT7056043.1 hypothetical protein [Lentisphaerota bacterium]MBT7847375.1 hypothetical protein [Lentisphaerota bacterium]
MASTEESTVLIWNNNMVGRGHQVMGHSSLNINGVWNHGGDITPNYVSWWPGDTGSNMAKPQESFSRDGLLEKYLPDHIIRLKSLDVPVMLSKWRDVRTKENAHYRERVKNCSTIVGRILRAGSEKATCALWYGHSVIWTPLKVKRLAFKLGGVEVDWKDFEQQLRKERAEISCRWMMKRDRKHGNPNTPARF